MKLFLDLTKSGITVFVLLSGAIGYMLSWPVHEEWNWTHFSLLLSSMMIPGVITMIPQFLVLKNFPLVGGNNIFGQGGQGLINHYAAIILPGAVGAYAVFFMKQFSEKLGRNAVLLLPDLFADIDDSTMPVRFAYMDLITELYHENMNNEQKI